MSVELSLSQRKKYLNTKVYFLYGEAKIFIVFFVALIIFKNKYILYMFLISYILACYLRYSELDIVTYFKRLISNINGRKYKKRRKTY